MKKPQPKPTPLRGRPRVRPADRRGQTVSVRFTAAELAAVDHASGAVDMPRGQWLAMVAIEAAARAAE